MSTCPDAILRLINRFELQSDQLRSPNYNEALIRVDFINPMMRELGWDIDNHQGFAEQYREVVHEDRVKVGGQTKAPDYSFRIGGQRKFFLEAKKPAVDIASSREAAYQLRRYAWSAKLACSLLSDFEELAIYDTRIQPSQSELASTARRELIRYTDYPARWDFLEGTFSKRAVYAGEFDRYCESKKSRSALPVDDAFLAEIEKWRKDLASNLALRNISLGESALNFAVQRIIDRIIFLRIAEDRGTEPIGQLQALLNGEQLYLRLCKLFRAADARYNSGLFHFQKEKDRDEAPDTLTPSLEIDDRTLGKIIKALYYPQSPFEFTMLSADILGSIYERFLGKVITLTNGHRAKIEDKPEVRKAGGVYYTPIYIVEYIVKNTVGKLLEGKTPNNAAKIRVLDPTCGSGSFLIGAYQYLLDWYLEQYTASDPTPLTVGTKAVIRAGPEGGWKLSITERKRILLVHIHGVDLDGQAVEVTKLNLLLKCLEGETSQTLGFDQRLFRERALPDLSKNILCGNSLIGIDIIGTEAWNAMSEPDRVKMNPFNYEGAFIQVFKHGGFDAVIGNPPWGAWLDDASLAYLRTTYSHIIDRMVDTYMYLICRGIQVKTLTGRLGFILPATVLNQVDATRIRRTMLDHSPQAIVGMGKDIFTKKVLNTSAIVILGGPPCDAIFLGDHGHRPLEERPLALASTSASSRADWIQVVEADKHLTFQLAGREKTSILSRLRTAHAPLSSQLIGAIERGVSPDVAGAHVIADKNVNADSPERALLRRSVSGASIGRYRSPAADQWIVYTTRSTPIEKYPKARAHLKQWEAKNTCREVKDGKHPIWALHRPRKPEIFASPKFIGLTTTKSIEVIYDATESLCVTDAMYVFKMKSGVDHRLVLAVLSSKLFLFLYRVSNMGEARVIPQVKAAKLEPLPFPDLTRSDEKARTRLASLVDAMLTLHKKRSTEQNPHRRDQVHREIDATDRQIDQLVYQLYGLTDDEIRIVETATAQT